TAALAFTTVTPSYPDDDVIFFDTFARGAATSAALTPSDRSRGKGPSVKGLSVGIDAAGNATLAFRSGEGAAGIRSVDLLAAGSVVELLVWVRGGVGWPTVSVSPGGSQSVVYEGWAGSPGQWAHGFVFSTRAVAGQPWSAPAIAP